MTASAQICMGHEPRQDPRPSRGEADALRYLPERRGQVRRHMTDLSRIIGDLIATKKEGDHWDFKREPHAKTGALIKDIICLANSPRHTGDRYIIYGVNDTGLVVGLQPSSLRTQADIVSTLSNAGFAGGVHPDIYLQQIKLQGQRLEVLVIKDLPEKPYYLQKKYHKDGVRLNPGTVYARVRDSNTPSDQVASSYDIERMWRQRFGLDQTPFQRVQNYLLDRDGWTETSEDVLYYSQFPEFTISPTEEEARPVQAGENWVRAATNPSAFVRPFRICFHQTVLAQVECIYYDEMRARTPAPRLTYVDFSKGLGFFSLSADTFEFLFLQFLTGVERDQLLQNGLSDGRRCSVPVILFRSGEEHQAFIEELERNPVTIETRHAFIVSKNDLEISEQDRRIIAFGKAVIEHFSEWRAKSVLDMDS